MAPPTRIPRPAPGPDGTQVNGHPAPGAADKPDPAAREARGGAISPPPKLRRRPTLIALGIALVALGGAAAAWLTTAVGHTQGVLAVRATIDRGSVIGPADLVTARINTDPALHPVPAGRRDQVVGKRAAVDLAAGTLITPDSVTTAAVPAPGQSLVGISLTPAQLPAQTLRPGATVRIVATPRAQDDPPPGAPAVTTALVVQAHPPVDDGQVVVDVTVPSGDAPGLAARAATGRVALVLDAGTR